MNKQTGFTLIELIMVIVILGVLAATAIPQFVDLSTQAEAAATDGVLGAVQSTIAINYAAQQMTPPQGTAIAACADVETAMQGGLPTDYSIVSAGSSCTLNGPGGQTRAFDLL